MYSSFSPRRSARLQAVPCPIAALGPNPNNAMIPPKYEIKKQGITAELPSTSLEDRSKGPFGWIQQGIPKVNKQQPMYVKGRNKQTFPFMRLPPEVRTMIYEYGLSATKGARRTIVQSELRSRTETVRPVLDYSYSFNVAMLCVSKTIFAEANPIWEENTFVKITLPIPNVEDWLNHMGMPTCRLNPEVYQDSRLDKVSMKSKKFAMHLDFNGGYYILLTILVIAAADLSNFCHLLLKARYTELACKIDYVAPSITLHYPNNNPNYPIDDDSDDSDLASASNNAYYKKLLNPLRRFHTIDWTRIKLDDFYISTHSGRKQPVGLWTRRTVMLKASTKEFGQIKHRIGMDKDDLDLMRSLILSLHRPAMTIQQWHETNTRVYNQTTPAFTAQSFSVVIPRLRNAIDSLDSLAAGDVIIMLHGQSPRNPRSPTFREVYLPIQIRLALAIFFNGDVFESFQTSDPIYNMLHFMDVSAGQMPTQPQKEAALLRSIYELVDEVVDLGGFRVQESIQLAFGDEGVVERVWNSGEVATADVFEDCVRSGGGEGGGMVGEVEELLGEEDGVEEVVGPVGWRTYTFGCR